jgi:hypothetical protein
MWRPGQVAALRCAPVPLAKRPPPAPAPRPLPQETLRVVPLFETLADLHNAPSTMRTLLGNGWYRAHIGGHQECMIGYSDSGKDAGGGPARRGGGGAGGRGLLPLAAGGWQRSGGWAAGGWAICCRRWHCVHDRLCSYSTCVLPRQGGQGSLFAAAAGGLHVA